MTAMPARRRQRMCRTRLRRRVSPLQPRTGGYSPGENSSVCSSGACSSLIDRPEHAPSPASGSPIESQDLGRLNRALRGASSAPPVGPAVQKVNESRGGAGGRLPHPLGGLGQPVTGGVKTPVIPTRLVLQRLPAIG